MRIGNVLGGYADPAALGKRVETTEGAARRAVSPAEPGSGGSADSSLVRQILSRYDMSNISPAEFSEMIQNLHQAGAISDGELQELSTVRTDLDADGISANKKIDLTKYYEQKLQEARQQLTGVDDATAQRRLTPIQRKLDWVQKFALMQSQPDVKGVNAVV
jgi:hypothetical protein